jgi:hypothetical protein
LKAAPSPRWNTWANNLHTLKSIIKETEVKQNQMGKMLMTFGKKNKTRIGFWNIRTMRESGKLRQVIGVKKNYRLHVLGISETRWLDFEEMTVQNGFTFLSSGATGENVKCRNGVGLLITKHESNSLMQWKPISERLLTTRIKTPHSKRDINSMLCTNRGNRKRKRILSTAE